ncbi:hypothetical protein RBB50_005016 [Rhinocladiella similis]
MWSTYLNTLPGFPLRPVSDTALDFPELDLLSINFSHYWQDVIGFRKGNRFAVRASKLYTLADILKQIGDREISPKFTSLLAPLIHDERDDDIIFR